MRHWPTPTDALRVMDDGGRTLLDWTLPAATSRIFGVDRLNRFAR
jgi:hypothetical protein